MRVWLTAAVVAALAVGTVGSQAPKKKAAPKPKSPHIVEADPLTPEEQAKKFRLPPGFAIQLVAAEPAVKKPINLAFDARGRLWVTGSEEYPFAAPPDRKAKDTVKILEDFAPDGRARKVTTFADNLNIPIGVLPASGGALVFSIPNIYWMPDANDDGVADSRVVRFAEFGFKDTHGMTGEFMRGFDGWVYCCHGFSNTSTVKGKGPEAITMQSGNTYRVKLDGSRVEPFTRGQVNPFGLAFDPRGDLYSADCHTRPLYMLLKGAYYPSFGKPHDGLGFGPEMVKHDHGSTAIAGVAYYSADQYPKEFRDNLFIGNVVTNRINRDRIEWNGSSPRGVEMPDFVTCDDPWFRPVDIKLGPDGALYVADFYNRIIGHYEVPLNHPGRDREKGRIWRIVYVGPDGKQGPQPVQDLTKASNADLVATLGHANLERRLHATHLLADRPESSADVEKLLTTGSAEAKAHALWVLQRQGKLSDETLKRTWDANADSVVRTHAMRIVGERAAWSDVERTLAAAGAKDVDAHVRRAAAQALGAHPSIEAVGVLTTMLDAEAGRKTHDPQLVHALRMALRDCIAHDEVASSLQVRPTHPGHAMQLCDAALGARTEPSADLCLSYVTRVWSAKAPFEPAGALGRKVHHAVRYGRAGASAELLAWAGKTFASDPGAQGMVVKSIQQALQERGVAWAKAELGEAEKIATKLLAGPDAAQGAEIAGMLRLGGTQAALTRVLGDAKADLGARKAAIAALLAIDAKAHGPTLAATLVSEAEPLALREQAAQALATSPAPEAKTALVDAFQKAPAPLQATIASSLASSKAGAEKLLDAVAAGKASARLLQDRTLEQRLKQTKLDGLDARLAKLTHGLAPSDQRLADLIAKRRTEFTAQKGDPKLGVEIFQKTCAGCHQIANVGGKYGPQLDGIGIRGLGRVLEDVLDPSRNVDQAFRATVLNLTNGQVVIGLAVREEGQVSVIVDGTGKELRIAKADIEERVVAGLSPMPPNFAEAIPADDFRHLIAYLLAQRVPAGKK